MKLVHGERVGRLGTLRTGCTAAIFDATRTKLLLTRRNDNARWCLPGGQMEPGESAAEACVREVWEETGLRVRVVRLIGVYSDPNLLLEYPDGKRIHIVGLHFEAEALEGTPGLSDEVTEVGYYAPDELASLDLLEHHRQRITDTLAGETAAFVR